MAKIKNDSLFRLLLSSLFLALGILLPFLTGQQPQINSVLLPMHIPVFLCSLLLGWRYGLLVGAVLPILRGAFFGFPVIYPTAIAMCFELGCYGFFSGWLYFILKNKINSIGALYTSLAVSMMVGRVARGLAQWAVLAIGNSNFPFAEFMAGTILPSLPGVIIQMLIIPTIVIAAEKKIYKKT